MRKTLLTQFAKKRAHTGSGATRLVSRQRGKARKQRKKEPAVLLDG